MRNYEYEVLQDYGDLGALYTVRVDEKEYQISALSVDDIPALLQVAMSPEVPEYPATAVDLPAYAAQKRWEREVGGTVWNGWPVLSDRESQSKIIAEAVAIEKGERTDGDPWKFADGEFRPLTNDQMDELAAAVRLHIRNSYGIEAQVLTAIEAGAITSEAQIDGAFA